MRLAALLVLMAAIASSGCGDGHPVSPSRVVPFAAPGVVRQLDPSDYHESPMPMPEPAPAPEAIAIDIVGSSGTAAFAPNPLQASMGATVVWTNTDVRVHQIVLDDGTMVGPIDPGQTSAPITVSAAAVTYRCTLHPSMVGSIQDPSVVTPPPETPPYAPRPDDDYGDYGSPRGR